MLIFGNTNTLHEYIKNNPTEEVEVLSFTSLASGYKTIDILPTDRFNIDDSQGFDIGYANYIMCDDYRFMNFMSIIYPLYEGKTVFILVYNSDFFDILNESLSKFIQQRYGYISNEVHDKEDLDSLISGGFSINGLYNLDMDKKRFIDIIETHSHLK